MCSMFNCWLANISCALLLFASTPCVCVYVLSMTGNGDSLKVSNGSFLSISLSSSETHTHILCCALCALWKKGGFQIYINTVCNGFYPELDYSILHLLLIEFITSNICERDPLPTIGIMHLNKMKMTHIKSSTQRNGTNVYPYWKAAQPSCCLLFHFLFFSLKF